MPGKHLLKEDIQVANLLQYMLSNFLFLNLFFTDVFSVALEPVLELTL